MLKSKTTLVMCLAVFGLGMMTMHASSALAGPGGRVWGHFVGKAQGQGGQDDCPMARLIHQRLGKWLELKDELGLTDQQRDAIHEILRNHRDELRPAIKTVIEQHRVLRNAVLADDAEETAIGNAATDMGTAIGDAAVVASQVAREVKAVLTPEQLTKLREFRADRQDAVDELMQHLTGE
jgi:Spy/CpxP family protein refolding chaperone